MYLSSNKSSLFSVEDDIDDDAFLKHPPIGNSNYIPTLNPNISSSSSLSKSHSDIEDRTKLMLQAKREIEERTIQSSQRSLSLLRHSEEVGNATAEELMRQREQLERSEKRLDEINTTLRFSQKHIQGIKSVFGSLKNYLSGKNSEPLNSLGQSSGTSITQPKNNILEQTSSSTTNSSHPGMRIRGLEESGTSFSGEKDIPVDSQQIIDKNLDEMMGSIGRLKGLAHGLGNEIDSQNDLVENILVKAEKSDITLQRQTKDIKRLLNYSDKMPNYCAAYNCHSKDAKNSGLSFQNLWELICKFCSVESSVESLLANHVCDMSLAEPKNEGITCNTYFSRLPHGMTLETHKNTRRHLLLLLNLKLSVMVNKI